MRGKPLLRAYCHCTICQAFNQASFADITVFRANDVDMPDKSSVDYATYRMPPAIQRGKCIHCGHPAIEYLNLSPLMKLVIVPSINIGDHDYVPQPSMHIFYDKRMVEAKDDLPKYKGYAKSQFGFGKKLVSQLIKRQPN